MEYRSANVNQGDGFFNWHVDAGDGYTSLRKFSIVIGLNNPEEYDGGDLVIQNGGMEHNVRLRKGDIAAFPAYINHCVTPVTRGVRNSIVVFIVGPRFV
jgi:PKHD-type hydroxylase